MSQHRWFQFGVWSCLIGVAPAQARVAPDDALRSLAAGNQRFVRGEQLSQPLGEGARRTLANGQAPWAIVLTSTDSRIAPEHIFNVGLGELFVVRIAGSVADPAALASVEYAAEHLGTPLCLVLGHHGSEFESLPNAGEESAGYARIAGRLRPAWQRAVSEGLEGEALAARAAQENTYETVAECLRRSAVLRELTRLDQFRLVPAMYSLATGEVSILPARPLPELVRTRQDEAGLRPKTTGLPPHVALAMLQAGHRRFLSGTNGHLDLSAPRRQSLVTAQRPFALVLTDADSRLSPEHLFDAGLGDLAVVRVIGCALDDEVLGSIEHAVREFGIGLVLVLSPDRCGVTELLLENSQPRLTPSLRVVADWFEPSILEARHQGLPSAQLHRAVVRANVQRTVREVRSRSPLLRRLIQRGQLGVLGATYRLVDGEIEWSRETPADDPAHAPASPDHTETIAPAEQTEESAPAASDHGEPPAAGQQHAAPADEVDPHSVSHATRHAGTGDHPGAAHREIHDEHPSPSGDHGVGAHGVAATPAHPRPAVSATPIKAPAVAWSMLLVNLAVLLAGAIGTIVLLRIGQRRAARRVTAP